MKSIHNSAALKRELKINDKILLHQPLESILKEKVQARIKHSQYDRIKKNILASEKSDFNLLLLSHHLDIANKSHSINQTNPINSNRNILVKQLALKIRHIIQNEIRFTLDPIIYNQEVFNYNSVNSLNHIFSFINKIYQFDPEYPKKVEELSRYVEQLKSDYNQLQNNHNQLQNNHKKLEEKNLILYIKFLYSNYLKRNPSKNEIENWIKLPRDEIQFDQISELIQDSAEAKTTQKKFLKSLGIKKDTHGFYKILEEHKIYFDINDEILLDSYSQPNFHETGTVSLVKKILHPKMIVINIGANVGFYSLLSAKLVGSMGKIFAFEPGVNALEFLELNVQINNYSNMTIIPKAVSNFTGNSDLHIHESITGNSLFPLGEGESKTISVPTISIDKFLEEKDIQIDLLIIDAEGAEQFILEGSQNIFKTNPKLNVILEFNPKSLKLAGTDAKSFLELIKQLGFLIFVIDEFEETIKQKSTSEILQEMKEDEHFNLYLTKEENKV